MAAKKPLIWTKEQESFQKVEKARLLLESSLTSLRPTPTESVDHKHLLNKYLWPGKCDAGIGLNYDHVLPLNLGVKSYTPLQLHRSRRESRLPTLKVRDRNQKMNQAREVNDSGHST